MSSALLPGSIIAMTDHAADRLLKLDNGDAALLYLYLLRRDNLDAHPWPQARLDAALSALNSLGMAPQLTPRADAPAEPLPPPEYRTDELTAVLADPASSFSSLCDSVEGMLGKKLNTMELKSLFTLYDHLALPAEVILMLVGWCGEETERKYGPGKKPSMTTIKKEGFVWARNGIDTLERADAHIQRLTGLHSRENEVLRLLDIPARPLVTAERNYIAAWDDMGFDNEALRMAYERTVLKKQVMDWRYMNAILRRWHGQGLHTAAAIEKGDHDGQFRRPAPQNPTPVTTTPQSPQDYEARMQRLLEQMKQEG